MNIIFSPKAKTWMLVALSNAIQEYLKPGESVELVPDAGGGYLIVRGLMPPEIFLDASVVDHGPHYIRLGSA